MRDADAARMPRLPDWYLAMRQAEAKDQPVVYYDFEDDFLAVGRVQDRAGIATGGGRIRSRAIRITGLIVHQEDGSGGLGQASRAGRGAVAGRGLIVPGDEYRVRIALGIHPAVPGRLEKGRPIRGNSVEETS